MLRQRDVYSRIYVSPREIDQCVAKRKNSPGRRRRVRPGAHPRRGARRRRRPSRPRSVSRARRASTSERGAARTSASSRSPTRTRARRSTAARSAGARQASCRRSRPTSSRASSRARSPSRSARRAGCTSSSSIDTRGVTGAALVSQVHARHILMETNAIEDDETVRRSSRSFRDRILKGESFEAIAAVNSVDSGLGGQGRRPRLGRPRHLRARVRAATRLLAENEISEPFKTQFGWHIVQLLGRRTYDATDDVIRNRCVRRCASRRRTKRPRSGCVACATRRSSNTACEPGGARPTIAVTTGEPAGSRARPGGHPARRRLERPHRPARRPRAARAARRPPGAGRELLHVPLAVRHARRATSTRPTPATCSPCSTRRSTAALPADSTRWSPRRCTRASSTTRALRSPATPNTWRSAPEPACR